MHACPFCSSTHHFLCAGADTVKLCVSTHSRDHVLAEIREGDLLVILMSQLAKFHVLPAGEDCVNTALAGFSCDAGQKLLIHRYVDDAESGLILVLGCGTLEARELAIINDHIEPQLRAACHAFDTALLEAGRHRVRRLLLESSELVSETGPALAAALHCRLQLAQATHQVDGLEEVTLLASGAQTAQLEAMSLSCGPMCRNCPFTR